MCRYTSQGVGRERGFSYTSSTWTSTTQQAMLWILSSKSVCLSVCLCVCLSVCLSVCRYTSQGVGREREFSYTSSTWTSTTQQVMLWILSSKSVCLSVCVSDYTESVTFKTLQLYFKFINLYFPVSNVTKQMNECLMISQHKQHISHWYLCEKYDKKIRP